MTGTILAALTILGQKASLQRVEIQTLNRLTHSFSMSLTTNRSPMNSQRTKSMPCQPLEMGEKVNLSPNPMLGKTTLAKSAITNRLKT